MNIPLHKKIRQDILNKIETNEYSENQLIPTELELAEIYGVSRPTIRQAIQALVNEGYLEKRKRRGTIVRKPKIQQEFTHVIESYDSEMSRKGLIFYFYSDRQKIRLQWLARFKNGLCGRANLYEQPFYRCGCELSFFLP